MTKDRKEYQRQYYLNKKLKVNNDSTIEKMFKPKSHKAFNFNSIKNNYLTCLILFIFIVANSTFLINEQLRFYVIKGYTISYAIFVSILCELAVIILSISISYTANKWKRVQIATLLFLTISAILGTIIIGILRDQSKDETKAEISGLLRKELLAIEQQALNNPKLSGKLLKKEAELRSFLISNEIVGNVTRETFILSFIRILAVFWNVIFASLIGTIWRARH